MVKANEWIQWNNHANLYRLFECLIQFEKKPNKGKNDIKDSNNSS